MKTRSRVVRLFTAARVRRAIALRLLLVTALALLSVRAHAADPVIVNSGSGRWLESTAIGHGVISRMVTMTFIVKHDLGTFVSGVKIDDDYNGSDSSAFAATRPVTAQILSGGFIYSKVTFSYLAPAPFVLNCPVFGTDVRRTNVPLRARVQTNVGLVSSPVTTNIHIVATSSCASSNDYAYVSNQSQNATSLAPGASVVFTFTADDPDTSGSDDAAAALSWRVRNSQHRHHRRRDAADLPVRQHLCERDGPVPESRALVVEGRIRSESGSFTDSGAYFRLGAIDVNSNTVPALSLSGAPSIVNAGAAFTVSATASDVDSPDGGRVQVIDWDANGSGSFERRWPIRSRAVSPPRSCSRA